MLLPATSEGFVQHPGTARKRRRITIVRKGSLKSSKEKKKVSRIELVSKELNHFGGIASFFRDLAPGTLTGDKKTFVYVPTVRIPGA